MSEDALSDYDAALSASFATWEGQHLSRAKVGANHRHARLQDDGLPVPSSLTPNEGCGIADISDSQAKSAPFEWSKRRLDRQLNTTTGGSALLPARLCEATAEPALAPAGVNERQLTKRKGKQCGQPRILTADLLGQCLDHVEATSPYPQRDALMVMAPSLLTFRPCEISGLRVRTLCTATGDVLDYVTIMPGTAKRGRQRTIPMHPQFRAALRRFLDAYPEAERIAFRDSPMAATYFSPAGVSTWFRTLYAAMGWSGYSAMSGRHFFANDLYRRGLPEREIQKLMGHANLKTTRIYLRSQEISSEAINRIGRPY